jgi:hypothetical protein
MPDENEQTANPDSDKIASKGKAHPADKDVGTTVSKPEVAQANPTAEGSSSPDDTKTPAQ